MYGAVFGFVWAVRWNPVVKLRVDIQANFWQPRVAIKYAGIAQR